MYNEIYRAKYKILFKSINYWLEMFLTDYKNVLSYHNCEVFWLGYSFFIDDIEHLFFHAGYDIGWFARSLSFQGFSSEECFFFYERVKHLRRRKKQRFKGSKQRKFVANKKKARITISKRRFKKLKRRWW